MLERVKTNGKDGGRAKLTLMRNWIMTHLVYDLLLSLPAGCSSSRTEVYQSDY